MPLLTKGTLVRGYALIKQPDGRIRHEDLVGRSRAAVLRVLEFRIHEPDVIVGIVLDTSAEVDELPRLHVVGDV